MFDDKTAVAEITRRLQARERRNYIDDNPGNSFCGPLPRIKCADGFSVSVQAGNAVYSIPSNVVGPWVAFELGYPSAPDDLIASYADDPIAQTDTVYGYVPAEVVEALIQKHGGIA